MERRGLIADRFQRIWEVVEYIAREPGQSRKQLAERFSLSERQVQADLNVIRTEMRLPLVRRHGYRFVNEEGGPTGVLKMQEAQASSSFSCVGLRSSARFRLRSSPA